MATEREYQPRGHGLTASDAATGALLEGLVVMNTKSILLARAALGAAVCFTTIALAQVTGSPSKFGTDFAGAFIVEHVATLRPAQGVLQVDIVGSGSVTGSVKATCDNHGEQVVSLMDGSGSATYTLCMPGGSLVLQLTAEASKAGGDPVHGIRFGGTYVVVPNSGTGCYKGATGSGVWSGSAEFTAMLVPGGNAPGPGRWAFWGTLSR